MDRALNPEHLGIALGGTTGLPTAAELMELLAEAEAGLLRGYQRVDDRLMATAWYLHSVGSALASLDIYGVERQRAAFQVSGHIFDLALNDAERDARERMRLIFASQVANLRGGLDPNAIAAYRLRPQRLETDPSALHPTVPMDVGTAMLALDTSFLFSELPRFRDQLVRAEAEWGISIHETVYGTVAHLLDGSWALLRHLVYGAPESLAEARARFRTAAEQDHAVHDVDARWVAFHLWQLCDQLGRSSLWAILPPDTPPSVPRAFTMGSPPILTLWPPQVDLLRADREPQALDPAVRRLILSVPTSAGKTLVAQVMAADHLARSATGVCFVAPTRSLCREIEGSLRQRLRTIIRTTDIQFRDALFEDAHGGLPSIEVMTPERLAYLMRTDSTAVLARFGLFIIDEAHVVGDKGRGWTLEWVVSTLHSLTGDTAHRIVAMSAALGNRATIATWLDPNGEGLHFASAWRGPRRVHAIYTTERDDSTRTLIPPPRPNSPARVRYELNGVLHLRPTASGRVHELRTTSPIGELVLRVATNQRDTGSTPFYQMIAPLATALGRAGPVLVVSPTRIEAARLASRIADGMAPGAGPRWLVDLATSRLGVAHPMVRCLDRGVAYHHSSLPPDVLLGIEGEVGAGRINFVVATTTLTEGVNLPVRTVIIAAQGAHGPDGFEEYVTGARLLNAIGRAGRAGKESEG